MLKEERQQLILDKLKESGKVLTPDLSNLLSVSEDTIRRDLKELSDLGSIKKVHGGAILTSSNPYDFRERQVYAQEAKARLAEEAVSQVRKGQVLFMDGGTTNLEVAKRLPQDEEITVFTNSLPVADILADFVGVRTNILGGTLLPSARVTTGPEVIQQIVGIHADICFLGTRSLHSEIGITEIDWDETLVKRAMVASSEALIALAIEEKLATTQPYQICPAANISTLITDAPFQDERLSPFQRLGIDLISIDPK